MSIRQKKNKNKKNNSLVCKQDVGQKKGRYRKTEDNKTTKKINVGMRGRRGAPCVANAKHRVKHTQNAK